MSPAYQTTLQLVTLAWLVLAVILLGAVHPLSVIILLSGLTITMLAALPQKLHWRLPKAIIAAAILISGISILQIIPWPTAAVKAILPNTYEYLSYLLLPFDEDLPAWIPAIFTPGQTVFGLARFMCAFLFLTLLIPLFSHHSHKRRWPLWTLLATAALAVCSSIFCELIEPGLIASFYPLGASGDALFPGFFINSNFQAGFYLLAFFTGLGLIGHDALNLNHRLWAGLLTATVFCGVIITASRGAILALTAALVFLAIIKRQTFHFKGWAAIILITLAGLALAWQLAAAHLTKQLATMDPSLMDWQNEKWHNWPLFTKIATEFWLLGSGAEGLAAVFPSYGPTLGKNITAAECWPLDFCLKFGLPATIILIGLAITLLCQFFRRRHFHFTEWAVLCGLGAWTLHNLVDFSWRSPAILMSAALLLAFLITSTRKDEAPSWYHPRTKKIALLPLGTIPLLILAISCRPHLPGQYDQEIKRSPAAAKRVFQQTRHWSPADGYLYSQLGRQLLNTEKQPNTSEILHYVNRALFLNNHDWLAHYTAARALALSGKNSQALLEYGTALNQSGPYKEQLLNAIWQEGRGQKLLLQLGGGSAPETQFLILAKLRAENRLAALEEAAGQFPFLEIAATPAQLGLAFKIGKSLKRLDIMEDSCNKIIKLPQTGNLSTICQAELLAFKGQPAAARDLLEKGLPPNCGPDDSDIFHALSDLFYYNLHDPDGLGRLLRLPAAQKNLDDLYYRRGVLYWERGRQTAAFNDWQKAVIVNPDSYAWYYIGVYHEQNSRFHLARQAYEKAVNSHPNYQTATAALKRVIQLEKGTENANP